MSMKIKALGAGGAIILAGCATAPDFRPVDVAGTSTADGPNTLITVAYGVRNDGVAPAIDPPGPDNSAEVRYYLQTADGSRSYALSSAHVTPPGSSGDIDLAPGMTLWNADTLTAGPNSAPAPDLTRVCVEVDGPNAVAELNETNNVACAPFPSTGKPDLIIESAQFLGVVEDTAHVTLVVRNVGVATSPTASPPIPSAVRISGGAPQSLAFNTCPTTYDAVRAGAPWTCSTVLGLISPLAPGARTTLDAYVLFPDDGGSGSTQTVEFTIDACLPPSLPAYCRIDERNEGNNALTLDMTQP